MAGFRSPFYIWVGGLNAVGGVGPNPPEPVLCPCPEYKVDATLSNQFMAEASLSNQFIGDATIVTQWKRGPCNG
jgi:hypothetical protein